MPALFDEFEQDTVPLPVGILDAGFTSFLEALVEDDELFASDDVATLAEQHTPSQPSKSISNQIQTAQFVSEHPREDQAGTNVVTASAASALTEAEKLEKVRAKNRRTQKAYKQRQKVLRDGLTEQINSVSQSLKHKRQKWRQLREQKDSLRQRLRAAIKDTPTNNSYSIPSESQDAPTMQPSSTSTAPARPAVESLQSHITQLVPRTAARSQFAARFSPFSGSGTGNIPEARPREVRRPISSFSRCEPFSFAEICNSVSPGEVPKTALKYNALSHAAAAYQHSISNRTGVPVADICWFKQWRFPGVEDNLSFSGSACSPACNIGVAVCVIMGHFEALLLVAEHEMLLEASDSSYKPPDHPTFTVGGTPVATPTPPDPGLLRRFLIPCGVNQTVPLGVGLDRTLKPGLAKYRASLPYDRWRAVCMQGMRILQVLVEAMAASTQGSAGSSSDDAVSKDMHHGSNSGNSGVAETTHGMGSSSSTKVQGPEQGMRWEDIGVAVQTAYQHILCILHEALQAPRHLDFVSGEAGGVSLAQVEERMFELVCTSHLNHMTFLEEAPVTARRTLVTQFITASQNIASRLNMKLYKQLQLRPDQRACMAERWRSWCRRRAALCEQLGVSVARFEEVCPQQTDISSALVSFATLVAAAADGKAPVNTEAQDTSQSSRNEVSSQLFVWDSDGSSTHEHSSVPMWSQTFSQFNPDEDSEEDRTTTQRASAMHEHNLCNSQNLSGSMNGIHPVGAEHSSDSAERHCSMHAIHDNATSAVPNDAQSMHDGSAGTEASRTHACQSCIFCGSRAPVSCGVAQVYAVPSPMHRVYSTRAPCMVCGEGRRALLLGESGEVAKAAYDALGSVLDVHTSDALMHFEFLGPFKELTEKQEALILASVIDLGQPTVDMTALWQIAAEEESREALFGHFTSLYV